MTPFDPQDPATWPTHLQQLEERRPPRPGAPLEAYQEWNLGIGPLVTDDTRKIEHAITQAQLRYRVAPLTGRQAVIIDGPPLAGKTYAALSVALSQTAKSLAQPPAEPTTAHVRPWTYLEVMNHNGAKSIVTKMAGSLGALVDRPANAADYLAAIRHMAPKVGLLGYIVDDSHGLLGAKSTQSTTLATALKGLITGIPAPAVIIGANLQRDGILQGTTGEQVRLSASHWVMCGDWPPPGGKHTTGWERLAHQLKTHLAFPDNPRQFQLRTRSTLQALVEGSLGRPGLAIKWAKDAAAHAVMNETVLDQRALSATEHLIDPAAQTVEGARK